MGAFETIPLGIRPPNVETPQDVWQRAANIQDTKAQAQLRAQQVIDAQLRNQLERQRINDIDEIQKTFSAPDPELTPKQPKAAPAAQAATNALPQGQPTVDLAAAEMPQGSASVNPASTETPPAAPQVDMAAAESTQETAAPAGASTSAFPTTQSQPATTALPVAPAPLPQASQSYTGAINNRIKSVLGNPRISYAGKMTAVKELLGQQKEILANSEAANKLQIAHNSRYVGLMDTVLKVRDPIQQEAAYQHAKAQAIAENLPGAAELPDHNPGTDAIIQQRNLHMLHSDQIAEAEKLPKLREDSLKLAGQTIDNVKDEAGYQAWVSRQPYQIWQELPEHFSAETPAVVKRMSLTQEQAAKQPGEQADAAQKVRENVSAQFNAANDLPSFSAVFDRQSKEVQEQLKASGISKETFDPIKTPKQLVNFGLKSNEIRQANYQDTEAKLNRDRLKQNERKLANTELKTDAQIERIHALDAKLSRGDSDRLRQSEVDKLNKQHTEYQDKEKNAWRLVEQYEQNAAAGPTGKIVDPKTGKEQVNTPALRSYYANQAKAARGEAALNHNAAYDIRKKLGGDLGKRYDNDGNPVEDDQAAVAAPQKSTTVVKPVATPATPPAQTPKPAAATSQHPIGSIRYGADGNLWKIVGYDDKGKAIVESASPQNK